MKWYKFLAISGGLVASGCTVQLGDGTESPTAPPSTSPTPTATATAIQGTPTPTAIPPTPSPTPTPTRTPEPPTQGPLGSDDVRPPKGDGFVLAERHTITATFEPAPNPRVSLPLPSDTGPYITPEDLGRVPYIRYRYQGSMVPVEAVIVGMPGFAGGAGSYDYMARALVNEGKGAIEVWAIDRRSNLLEDSFGVDAAEAAQDFQVGADYYFRKEVVNGEAFEGFLEDTSVPYLSEWGLALTLHDLNAVISQVPTPWRNQVVFLAGHSLGGTLVQHYASMDFDGDDTTLEDAGYNQIAGLIVLDGGSDPQPAQSRSEYETALLSVRTRDRITSFPGLTPDVHVLLDLFGMQSVHAPTEEAPLEEILDLDGVNGVFLKATIYGGHRYTWRGALGAAIDDNFQVAYTQQASVGFMTGGPLAPSDRGGQIFYSPPPYAEGHVVYGWDDYDTEGLPLDNALLEEVASIDDLAYSLYLGPSSFTEWYMPSRISVDLGPVRNFSISGPEDYRASEYGLALFHNERVDVPVLGFFGGAEDNSDAPLLQEYKTRISQTLRNGESRDEGFKMQICGGYEHLDVLFADWENGARPSIVLESLVPWMGTYGLLGSGTGVSPSELAPVE